MIFACGKCRTRYKLPDEKVSGRVLRVRCKSCGAVVHVRDPALPVERTSAVPASEAEWFVAVNGQQHGPMTLASLLSLAQDGTVTKDNYAWREGMEAWLKIREIDVLEQLLSAASAPPVPASSLVSESSPDPSELDTERPQASTKIEAPKDPTPTKDFRAGTSPEAEGLTHLPQGASRAEGASEEGSASSSEDEGELVEEQDAQGGTPAEKSGASDANTALHNGPQLSDNAEAKSAPSSEAEPPALEAEPPALETLDALSEHAASEPLEASAAQSPESAAQVLERTATIEAPLAPAPSGPSESPPSGKVAAASAAMLDAMAGRPADSQAKTVEDPVGGVDVQEGRLVEDQAKTVEDPMAEMRHAQPLIEEVTPLSPESETTAEDILLQLDDVEPLEPTPEIPEIPDVRASDALSPDAGRLAEPPDLDEGALDRVAEDVPGEADAFEPPSPEESARVEEGGATPTDEESDTRIDEAEEVSNQGAGEESTPLDADLNEDGPGTESAAELELKGAGFDEVDAWFDDVPQWQTEKSTPEGSASLNEPKETSTPARTALDSQVELEAILGESMRFAGKASKDDKALLKKALEAAPDMDVLSAIDAPSRAEMKTLRKEFSVVQTLEANQRKRVMMFAVAAALLTGLGVGAMFWNNAMKEGVSKPDYGPTKSAPEVKRTLYEVPAEEVMPAAPGGVMSRRGGGDIAPKAEAASLLTEVPSSAPAKKKKSPKTTVKKARSPKAQVNQRAKKEAAQADKLKKMSRSEFAQLTGSKDGKSELKLPTGSKRLSSGSGASQSKKGRATASERAQKVTGIIAKKRRLLVRCKGGEDEKVKVTFTIASTGKVTSVRIKGTQNERKKSCIANVFWRSYFPKGEQSETFSLPFTI